MFSLSKCLPFIAFQPLAAAAAGAFPSVPAPGQVRDSAWAGAGTPFCAWQLKAVPAPGNQQPVFPGVVLDEHSQARAHPGRAAVLGSAAAGEITLSSGS